MPPSGRLATRANALSALRLAAAPALVAAIGAGRPGAASALFALAVATDLADGVVARRRGEASPLGGLVDHAVDATFVTAGTAALAARGELPALLPALIALAFLQYALDSRWQGAGALRGSPLGRWNGIAYYVAVAVPVVRDALALPWPGRGLVMALGWALVAATLVSVADRLRRVLAGRRARGSPA
jgi:phosphatidylglycerophosphate synthase